MPTTWTLSQPLNLETLDFLSGDGPVLRSITSSTHYRHSAGDLTLDFFGSGLRYDSDGDWLPFGDIFRIDLFDGLDQALQVLEVVWDLLHILSYYNPLTDHWDSEGLLDYLFEEVDWFDGSEGDDTLAGRGGDDRIDGDGGIDTAVYRGTRADYTLQDGGGAWTVRDRSGRDGNDALFDVERLRFADGALALDLDGHAGTVARLIGTLFGPEDLARTDLAGIGLALLDGGTTGEDLAAAAVASDLFAQAAGSHADADFVRQVHRNLTGREADETTLAHYTGLLASGVESQASLAWWASQTQLAAERIDLAGLAQQGLGFEPAG